MLKFVKTHLKAVIITAVAVVAAALTLTVLALTIWLPQNVDNSSVGQNINKLTTTKPVSIMVAPADAKWWNVINNYTPTLHITDVPFDSLPVKPNNLAWSLSDTDVKIVGIAVGLNTVVLEYNTAEQAAQVKEYLLPYSQNGFQVATAENLVMLIPMFSNTTENYTLQAYKATNTSSPLTDKAYWNIDLASLTSFYKTHTDTKNDTANNTIMSLLGFITDKTVWKAESVDGLNWSGNVSTPFFDASKLDTAKLEKFLVSTAVFTPNNPADAGKTASQAGHDIIGVTKPNQSAMLTALGVSTASSAWGGVYDDSYENIVPVEKTSTEGTTVSITPNVFSNILLGVFDGADASTNFSNIKIVFPKDTNKVELNFTVGAWAK